MATKNAVILEPRVEHLLLLLSKSVLLVALPDLLHQSLLLHEPFLWSLEADQGPQPHIAGGDDVVQVVDLLCDGGGNYVWKIQLGF